MTPVKNLGILKEMELIKLTISYDIIYDKHQRVKV